VALNVLDVKTCKSCQGLDKKLYKGGRLYKGGFKRRYKGFGNEYYL
jgi:hypothetical protein